MMRSAVMGVGVAALLASSCGVAMADPVEPSPGAACTADLDGAMTLPTGAKTPLVCGAATWEPVTTPYPISAKWVSSGPAMTLHGQGRPNPNLLSGAWTATPLSPETSCSATQLAVIPGSPTVGAPRVDRSPAGQPLSFDVVPILFTIEMSGDCLWQQTSQPTA
jgi:hypothetical protein